MEVFKQWFEDPNTKKTWHNYGFDRHVLYNEGVDCQGFAGDTMHMARLWDSSRDKFESTENGGGKGYSLEALSFDLVPGHAKTASMKELFGVAKPRKDGSEGSLKTLPPVEDLQTDKKFRQRWIKVEI